MFSLHLPLFPLPLTNPLIFPCLAFSVTAIYAVTVPANGIGNGNGETFTEGPSAGQLQPRPEGQAGPDTTPPGDQILCQQPQPTEEEQIARQEQAARDLDKAVVGLEIAQGAIEITLGAIRIAAAATTADVIRRQDAIAASIASASNVIGFEGPGTTPEPIRRSARDTEEARRPVSS